MNKKLLQRNKKYNSFIDRDAYRELDLYIDNDEYAYKKKIALTKNYRKKIAKGNFDFNKAEKGVLNNIVNPLAREYNKKFGSGNVNMFEKRTREAVARSQLRQIYRRGLLGNDLF